MEENMNTVNVEAKKRPTFLTVLCILTFIGSGLGVLSGLIMLIAAGMSDTLSTIPFLGNAVEAASVGGTTYTIISLLLSITSLYGAISMWGLKKMGFYLYLIAQILMLIIPFIFLPTLVAMAGFIVGIIFTAAFIIMYAVNLKHLS
jgi:hypothetical protein